MANAPTPTIPAPIRSPHHWKPTAIPRNGPCTTFRSPGGIEIIGTGLDGIVAVADSGIATNHVDLAGRLFAAQTVINGTADDNDHGTMVTGAITANAANAVRMAEDHRHGKRAGPVRQVLQYGRWPKQGCSARPRSTSPRVTSRPISANG